MKRIYASLVFALAVLMGVSLAYADMSDRATLGGPNATQVYDWRVDSSGDLIPGHNNTNTFGDSTHVVSNVYANDVTITTGQERALPYTIGDLYIMYSALASISVPSTSTKPGLEYDNLIPSLVWADGETTPAMLTFKVPADYKSGGAFRVVVDESDSTTPNELDFAVYISRDASTSGWDSAASDQTPVALAGTAGTPDVLTLSVQTDFSSLAPGDIITLSAWRDDTATGTGDLELYYLEFYYTANR